MVYEPEEFTGEEFLQDPKMNYFELSLQRLNYRRSLCAPLGLYTGTVLRAGFGFLLTSQSIYTGTYDAVPTSSGFVNKHEIETKNTHSRNGKRRVVGLLGIDWKIGRTFILNEYFSINAALNIPLLTLVAGGFKPEQGYLTPISPLNDFFEIDYFGDFKPEIEYGISQESDWYNMMSNTLFRSNSIGLEIGFRFHF